MTRDVDHHCHYGTPEQVRHTTPIVVDEVTECTIGTRYRGTRCDGTRIEWIEER